MAHSRNRFGGVAAAALAVSLLAACNSGAAATLDPVAGPTAGAAGPSTGPSAIPTIAATPAPPPPSVAPAKPLDLVWEAAGDMTNAPGISSTAYPEVYWPAIDPKTGNIWVAYSTGGKFWIFAPDGTPKGTFGAPGKGPGQFDFRRNGQDVGAGAMAFAPDGSFFVADDSNTRIQAFDADHKFVREWGGFGGEDGHFVDPTVIATDGTLVYVYDDQRGDIQVFDTKGTFIRKFQGQSGWIAVDTAGHLFVSGRDITEYDATGAVMHQWPVPNFRADYIGLAVDSKGRMYFDLQDPHQGYAKGLVRFDPATGEFTRWSTGGETLVIDPTDSFAYVANYVSQGWPKAALRKYALPTP